MGKNLKKLKILTDYLVDRDLIRAQVIELFDSFCINFPIKFSAWVVDYDFNIISVRGYRGRKHNKSKNISSIFYESFKDESVRYHKNCSKGSVETFISNENEEFHLVKLIPSEKRSVIFGISMDISSIVNLVIISEKACSSNKDCETLRGLHESLKEDDLYKLVKESIGDKNE